MKKFVTLMLMAVAAATVDAQNIRRIATWSPFMYGSTTNTDATSFLQYLLEGDTNAVAYLSATVGSESNQYTPPGGGFSAYATDEVFIANRTDDENGTGTMADPYKANTADDLDNLMASLIQGAVSNKTFTFMPGNYYTANGITVPAGSSNVVIQGSGGASVIYKDNNDCTVAERVIYLDGPNPPTTTGRSTNIMVKDLVLDAGTLCAAGADGIGKVSGVAFMSVVGMVLDTVTVTNMYSTGQPYEAFGAVGWTTNSAIRNMTVKGRNGSYGSGITAMGERVFVTDNQVDLEDYAYNQSGVEGNNATTAGIALYLIDSVISGNVVKNVDKGIMGDSGGGDAFVDQVWQNILISDNQVQANRATVYVEDGDSTRQRYWDFNFVNNTFDGSLSWVAAFHSLGLLHDVTHRQRWNFVANRFVGDPTHPTPLAFDSVLGVTMYNNFLSKRPEGLHSQDPGTTGSGNMILVRSIDDGGTGVTPTYTDGVGWTYNGQEVSPEEMAGSVVLDDSWMGGGGATTKLQMFSPASPIGGMFEISNAVNAITISNTYHTYQNGLIISINDNNAMQYSWGDVGLPAILEEDGSSMSPGLLAGGGSGTLNAIYPEVLTVDTQSVVVATRGTNDSASGTVTFNFKFSTDGTTNNWMGASYDLAINVALDGTNLVTVSNDLVAATKTNYIALVSVNNGSANSACVDTYVAIKRVDNPDDDAVQLLSADRNSQFMLGGGPLGQPDRQGKHLVMNFETNEAKGVLIADSFQTSDGTPVGGTLNELRLKDAVPGYLNDMVVSNSGNTMEFWLDYVTGDPTTSYDNRLVFEIDNDPTPGSVNDDRITLRTAEYDAIFSLSAGPRGAEGLGSNFVANFATSQLMGDVIASGVYYGDGTGLSNVFQIADGTAVNQVPVWNGTTYVPTNVLYATELSVSNVDIGVSNALVVGTDHQGYLTNANTLGGVALVMWVNPPATATDTGYPGQCAYDGSYLYVCSATNTWVRTATATW